MLDIESIFQDKKLKEMEEHLQLPIRTPFAILLLYCCDKHGEFELNSDELKKDILPYVDIDFNLILNSLCEIGLIEKFPYHGKTYGQILLENYVRDIKFPEERENDDEPLEYLYDRQSITSNNSTKYH